MEKLNEKKDELKVLFPNIKRIKKFYNWYPKTKLDLGLKKNYKIL